MMYTLRGVDLYTAPNATIGNEPLYLRGLGLKPHFYQAQRVLIFAENHRPHLSLGGLTPAARRSLVHVGSLAPDALATP